MKEALYDLYGYNKTIFCFINHLTNKVGINKLLLIVSKLFDVVNFPIYYLLACFFIYTRLKNIEPVSRYEHYSKMIRSLTQAAISYTLLIVIYTSLKFLLNMPRPYCSLPADQFITIIDTTKQRCLSSFPSSHAALAVLISFFAWSHLSKYKKLLAVLLVVLTAISRITLSMHYPADIVYSYLIISCILIITKTITRLEAKRLDTIYQWLYRRLFNHLSIS